METVVTVTCLMYLELFLAVYQAIKDIFKFQSLKGNGLYIYIFFFSKKDIKILSIFKSLI